MRKILFRGKKEDSGQWICSESIYHQMETLGKAIYLFDENLKDKVNTFGDCWIPVISETVGQFTGLIDKKGKEIFEGDIVSCSEFENNALPSLEHSERELFTIDELKGRKEAEYISEVFYDEANFYVNEGGSCEVPLCCFFGNMKHSSRIYEIEIIGNKYDNPELLNQ